MNVPAETDAPPPTSASVSGIRRVFAKGFLLHGASMAMQRGFGFATNIIIARLGGPSLYGGYALGISTAGTAANYFGLAIGSTASRFAGAAPRGSAAYRRVVIALAAIALAGAVVAAASLAIFARPIASRVLGNVEFTGLVMVTGLVAAALIMQEATLGLFGGLLEFRPLVAIPLVVGVATLAGAVVAAPFGAPALLITYAASVLVGVLLVVVVAKSLLWPRVDAPGPREGPSVRAILGFGATEVAGSIGVSIASWWVVALVAANDASLAQSAFFGVANQVRSLAILVPSFFLPLVIPLLMRYEGDRGHVLAFSTFLTVGATSLSATVILVLLPLLIAFYGGGFAGSHAAVATMVGAGALSIVASPFMRHLLTRSVRPVAIAFLVSSAMLAVVGTLLVPRMGAMGAALAWAIAEAMAAMIILAVLAARGEGIGHALRIAALPLLLFTAALAMTLVAVLREDVRTLARVGAVLVIPVLVLVLASTARREAFITSDDLSRGLAAVRRKLS